MRINCIIGTASYITTAAVPVAKAGFKIIVENISPITAATVGYRYILAAAVGIVIIIGNR